MRSAGLSHGAEDYAERLESELTGEWLYVFKLSLAHTVVYVKLVLRAECIVVSFHKDEGGSREEST